MTPTTIKLPELAEALHQFGHRRWLVFEPVENHAVVNISGDVVHQNLVDALVLLVPVKARITIHCHGNHRWENIVQERPVGSVLVERAF